MIPNDLMLREVSAIPTEGIRDFATFALEHAPPYFWEKPSSSTGKYHPAQSNGDGGLVRHTVAVATLAKRMCESFGMKNGPERDAVIAACLLHDILKYGIGGGQYTTKNHDYEGATYVKNLAEEYMQKFQRRIPEVKKIIEGVAWHMGPWTDDMGGTRPLKKFPEEYEPHMMIVHLADNTSAEKNIHLLNLEESLVG